MGVAVCVSMGGIVGADVVGDFVGNIVGAVVGVFVVGRTGDIVCEVVVVESVGETVGL